MKILAALLMTVAVLLLLSPPAHAQSQQTYYDGVLSVKFEEDAIENVSIQKTGGAVRTGLPSVNRLNRRFDVQAMRRIFPSAGADEAKHRRHGLHRWYRLALPESADEQAAATAYATDSHVEIAEPVQKKVVHVAGGGGAVPLAAPEVRMKPEMRRDRPAEEQSPSVSWLLDPNDPLYQPEQYHFNNTGQSGGTPDADIDLPEALDLQTGDPSVIVAVHDGGIKTDHPDLAGGLWTNEGEIPGNGADDDGNGYVDDVHGYNFEANQGPIVANAHGTHTAGTVAARTNNGTGVAGVAGGDGTAGSGVRLMSAQIFSPAGSSGGIPASYTYAADNGAVISQNSWGNQFPDVFDQAVLDGIDYFKAEAGGPGAPMNGGVVIFSAGNANSDANYYPGYYAETIAVAATDRNDERIGVSNYGDWVDLAAPGAAVVSTFVPGAVLNSSCQDPDGDGYGFCSGTSMAAPHASGVAALIASFGSGITPANMRTLLTSEATTDNIDDENPGYVGLLGNGRLNALKALQGFDLDDATPPGAITDLAATAGSRSVDLTWTAPADDAGQDASGAASSYEIRYATSGPITNAPAFEAATPVNDTLAPALPGTAQSMTVEELDFETQYWFAVRAIDDNANTSLSNSPSATTGPAPVLAYTPDSLGVDVQPGQDTTLTLTLENTGAAASQLTFSFPRFAADELLSQPGVEKNDTSRPLDDADHAKGRDPHGGAGHPVLLGTGGPDAFGYEWIDSNEPGGPAYDFFDITGVGTQVALDDEDTETVALPFDFEFYGETKTDATIGSNGYLTFDDTDSEYGNDPIPDADQPNDLIALFWDDLDPAAGDGQVHYYHDAAGERFIVQYTDVREYSGDAGETYTFQVILSDGGSILFQYKDMGGGGDLESATIGIENVAGDVGLQVAYNTTYLADNMAVAIATKPDVLTDVSPASGSISGGNSQDIQVSFSADDVDEPGTYEDALTLFTNASDSVGVSLPVALRVPSPLVLNELLASVPTSPEGDANEDGTTDALEDQFVEIANPGGSALDLSGYTLSTEAGVRHTFPNGTVVDSAVVVFGGGSPGAIPGITQTASEGSLDMSDGSGPLTLKNAGGTVVASVSYGPSAPAAAPSPTGESSARAPDFTGPFTPHSTIDRDGDGSADGLLFSPGLLNAMPGALPVEFGGAPQATLSDGDVLLQWRTLSETGSAGFQVQQRTPDASSFEDVSGAFVESKAPNGTSTQALQYSARLEGLAPGQHTLRLKQVDIDDEVSFSEIVEVNVPARFALSAPYPNPFRESARLDLTVPEAQQVTASVYNVLGQRVRVLHDGRVKATRTLRLEAGSLASGLYLIRVEGETFREVRQVTLVR